MKDLTKHQLRLILHSGIFHADDVFVAASISLINPSVIIIRTRDPELIKTGDVVFDVGDKYDPEKGYFDHHQEGFKECNPAPNNKFEKGPLLCSMGLLWRHYSYQVIEYGLKYANKIKDKSDLTLDQYKEISENLRKNLVMPIDANDNGQQYIYSMNTGYIKDPSLSYLIRLNNPTDDEMNDVVTCEKYFNTAVEMAKFILIKMLVAEFNILMSVNILDSYFKTNLLLDGKILKLDRYVPWYKYFRNNPEQCKDILFVVFPNQDDNWMASCIYIDYKVDKDKYPELDDLGERRKLRCPFPRNLGGKRDEELSKITNIPTAVFVHTGLFTAVAKTFNDIIALCKYAIDHPVQTNINNTLNKIVVTDTTEDGVY